MKIALIVNGEMTDLDFLKQVLEEQDYVICADGAARYLAAIQWVPDLLVGDFDSIDEASFNWMKEQGVAIETFPAQKDFTDSELALHYALQKNPREITLLGAIGSRWDHSVSNIMLLDRLNRLGIRGRLVSPFNSLTITDKPYQIKGRPGDIISILPLTEQVTGVTLVGLEYPLTNHCIERGSTLGISNCLLGTTGEIHLDTGILLVYQGREK